MINSECGINSWFCRGRTTLIPKPGEWSIANQRPITCLNTQYKWFTSVILYHLNQHLDKYQLMQRDQRGAKAQVSGTIDNLLIDDMVMRDAAINHRSLSVAWVDVRKAFDSVSHSWLQKMFEIHRVPAKITKIVNCIIKKWSVIIQIPVKEGIVQTNTIRFLNGELQGDSFCPTLYTLATNTVSWKIRSFQGYVLSRPIKQKVTHALFIDDLKCYQKRSCISHALSLIRKYMEGAGLKWNLSKCKCAHIKRGHLDVNGGNIMLEDGVTSIESLKLDDTYKYMGVPQSDQTASELLIESLKKKIQQRSFIIWSSDLSDFNKVVACNMFVNSSIEYYFWSQKFTINSLKEMDIIVRKSMNKCGC